MKYVMLTDQHGAKWPFIFPETVNHVDAAAAAVAMLEPHGRLASVTSGGYIGALHPQLITHGACTSLGGMGPSEMDAARIVMGQSASMMPDELVGIYFDKYRRAVEGEEKG